MAKVKSSRKLGRNKNKPTAKRYPDRLREKKVRRLIAHNGLNRALALEVYAGRLTLPVAAAQARAVRRVDA